MLETWLRPIAADTQSLIASLYQYQFGKNIDIYQKIDQLPDLKTAQVALIGLDAAAADAVRPHLYALSFPFGNSFKVVDLGNVRKYHSETIIPVLQELLTAGIVPVLLGANDADLPYLQYRSYRHLDHLVTIGLVADAVPYSVESGWQMHPEFWLNRIVTQSDHYLFNLSVLAYQSHFTDPQVFAWLDTNFFEYLRLGRVKQHLDETEPLLRDADMIAINLNALKQADAPASANPSPNGLTAEELCQIARYAGFSDKLSSFSVYNFLVENDKTSQTTQLVAQALWYFMDGLAARKHDYPIVTSNFSEYIIEMEGSSKPIVFWKSNRSERWWLQVPSINNEKQARHRLFPCSYNDYLQACNNEFSERILLAYRRFL